MPIGALELVLLTGIEPDAKPELEPDGEPEIEPEPEPPAAISGKGVCAVALYDYEVNKIRAFTCTC